MTRGLELRSAQLLSGLLRLGYRHSRGPEQSLRVFRAYSALVIAGRWRLTWSRFMNTKLLLKTILAIFVALLLVLMGMNNPYKVEFRLPPIFSGGVNGPAALMYFAFFAVGLLTGICLMAGSGKKGGGSSKSSK